MSNASGKLNPFPGLRPFTQEEDYLFFGREEQTTELLTLLRKHRLLAVVGTSGSGKSSLVRAGLLPELLGGTIAEYATQRPTIVLFDEVETLAVSRSRLSMLAVRSAGLICVATCTKRARLTTSSPARFIK